MGLGYPTAKEEENGESERQTEGVQSAPKLIKCIHIVSEKARRTEKGQAYSFATRGRSSSSDRSRSQRQSISHDNRVVRLGGGMDDRVARCTLVIISFSNNRRPLTLPIHCLRHRGLSAERALIDGRREKPRSRSVLDTI